MMFKVLGENLLGVIKRHQNKATYISTVPTVAEAPRTSRLLGTPRNGSMTRPFRGSMTRPSGRINLHPSILPPSMPNPMPLTADQDRKYMASEGTLLVANVWVVLQQKTLQKVLPFCVVRGTTSVARHLLYGHHRLCVIPISDIPIVN